MSNGAMAPFGVAVNSVVICREGNLRNEKLVFVRQGRSNWCVDPQDMLFRATGRVFYRQGCIVSFADGVKGAGLTVYIHRWGKHTFHYNKYPTKLLYNLIGRAWALNQWDALVKALQENVRRERAVDVLEQTAEYYIDHPYKRELKLIINL